MTEQLIIAGVTIGMDVFFKIKSKMENVVKVGLTINQMEQIGDCLALNISITNKSKKPCSILNMFMQQGENTFEACQIIETKPQKTANTCTFITFKADMFNMSFTPKKYFNLKPFNVTAYLLENQAETGWVLFKVNPENTLFGSFAIKVSGCDEILYTFN